MYRIIKDKIDTKQEISTFDFLSEFTVEETLTDGTDEIDTPIATVKNSKEKLEEEAEQVLEKAREEAENILRAARDTVDMMSDKAYKEAYEIAEKAGYVDGFDRGKKEAYVESQHKLEQEVEMLRKEVAEVVLSYEKDKEQMLDLYLDDLKEIAVSIGEKIVQTSLKSSKEIVEKMILSATEKMKKQAWAKVYIGAEVGTLDIQGDEKFLKSLSKIGDNVKLVLMEDKEPGTCIIETPEGVVDISVKTQLENIKEILNNARL